MQNTLNQDVLLEIIYRSDIKTIKNLCKTDSATKALCDANKNRIYKRLLLRDFNISIDTIPLMSARLFFDAFIKQDKVSEIKMLEKIAEKLNIEPKHLKVESYPIAGFLKKYVIALVMEIASRIHDYPSVLYNVISTLFKDSEDAITPHLMRLSLGIININHENFLFDAMYLLDYDLNTPMLIREHVNQVNINGDTPLTHYIDNNRYDTDDLEFMIQILLDGGADVNFQNSRGNTALHKAVYKDTRGLLTPLLLYKGYGANVFIKNKYGFTAVDLSLELPNPNKFLRLVKNTLQGKKIQINRQVYNRVKKDLSKKTLKLLYEISDVTPEPGTESLLQDDSEDDEEEDEEDDE
jgi:hypothetical protein